MTYEYPATLLPPNHTRLERHLEMVIRHQFAGLPVDVLRQFWNPATCPAHLLPHLARQRSVDVWNDAWSDERKRAVIAASIQLHRIKGTRAAIELALDALGQQYEFLEWWEQGALNTTPCTASLAFEGSAVRASGVVMAEIMQAVHRAKRLALHISITVFERLAADNKCVHVVESHANAPVPTATEWIGINTMPTVYIGSHADGTGVTPAEILTTSGYAAVLHHHINGGF